MLNEQLAARIQAGIDEAENMLQLWQQNEPFIRMMGRRFAGQGKADPTATISSVALMLDFMGFVEDAERVRAAIDADMAARAEAAAAGPPLVRSTSQIGDDIAARV